MTSPWPRKIRSQTTGIKSDQKKLFYSAVECVVLFIISKAKQFPVIVVHSFGIDRLYSISLILGSFLTAMTL